MYTLSVLSFPIMFYVLFGLVLNSKGNRGHAGARIHDRDLWNIRRDGRVVVWNRGGLASDRGLGWLQVKRASPMPPFAYFVGEGSDQP
jgi:ABC-2 type transport system permease protein